MGSLIDKVFGKLNADRGYYPHSSALVNAKGIYREVAQVTLRRVGFRMACGSSCEQVRFDDVNQFIY
ncbi:MAG: hypothetical protein K2L00_10000, partial [Muribaculaceae bacterium]|nr:hypothetical protein [Muribaculaceae bacterium]